jgi:hypothetical protein
MASRYQRCPTDHSGIQSHLGSSKLLLLHGRGRLGIVQMTVKHTEEGRGTSRVGRIGDHEGSSWEQVSMLYQLVSWLFCHWDHERINYAMLDSCA